MSSDKQFTAKGPANVGFQTNPTGGTISKGAEIEGDDFGIIAHGRVGADVAGDDFGIIAHGKAGGQFSSPRGRGQIHLVPHEASAPPATPVTQVVERKLKPNRLPKNGQLGDLFLTSHDGGTLRSTLWLCVNATVGKAQWAQVLLGTPIEGTFAPLDK
jgi:hypothetical protein